MNPLNIKNTLLVLLFLIPKLIIAEVINGPANLREERGNKIIAELKDGEKVNATPSYWKKNWYYTEKECFLPIGILKGSIRDVVTVIKDTAIYNSRSEVIGKVFGGIDFDFLWLNDSLGFHHGILLGSTYQANIRPESVSENILDSVLSTGIKHEVFLKEYLQANDFISWPENNPSKGSLNWHVYIKLEPEAPASPDLRFLLGFYAGQLSVVISENRTKYSSVTLDQKVNNQDRYPIAFLTPDSTIIKDFKNRYYKQLSEAN